MNMLVIHPNTMRSNTVVANAIAHCIRRAEFHDRFAQCLSIGL